MKVENKNMKGTNNNMKENMKRTKKNMKENMKETNKNGCNNRHLKRKWSVFYLSLQFYVPQLHSNTTHILQPSFTNIFKMHPHSLHQLLDK